MKQVTTKAIVLKRTNFQEADKILTLLTQDHGKIKVIAKGVRKLKSKLAGGLELLSISDVTYIVGRSDIYTVVSTRLDKHFQSIVSDIERTMRAYDMIKRIDKLSEDHAGHEFFGVLGTALTALNDLSLHIDVCGLWFDLHVLDITGHRPDFYHDVTGSPLQQDGLYAFDFETMRFQMATRHALESAHIKLLRLAQELQSPEQLKNINNTTKYIGESYRLSKQLTAVCFD